MGNQKVVLFGRESIACECEHGVNMCKATPCWGTPAQILFHLRNGVDPEKFWIATWTNDQTGAFIDVVAPAAVGHGNTMPLRQVFGRCFFLTEDERCALHGKHKPISGAVACCKTATPGIVVPFQNKPGLMWDTKEGRRVVAHWKMLVGR